MVLLSTINILGAIFVFSCSPKTRKRLTYLTTYEDEVIRHVVPDSIISDIPIVGTKCSKLFIKITKHI